MTDVPKFCYTLTKEGILWRNCGMFLKPHSFQFLLQPVFQKKSSYLVFLILDLRASAGVQYKY